MKIFKNTLTEWFICLLIAAVCFSPQLAKALEFQVDKNAAFNFTAPLINSTNTSIFSVGNNNTAFYINSNDNTTFAAAATNITRIDAGGIYLWQLNASEMNHDRIGVYYNGTGALQQYFVINTVPKEQIDTRGTGNLTTADLAGLTNVTLAATQTGVTIPTVTAVTNAVGISAGNITSATFAAGAIDANAIAANAITSSEIADDAIDAGAIAASAIGASEIATAAIDADAIATDAIGAAEVAADAGTEIGTAVWATTTRQLTGTQAFNLTGNITGNVSGSVGSISGVTFPGNFSSLLINTAGNVTANPGASGATAQQVWEYNISAINTTGYAGTYVKSAASAGDPWATDVSSGYTGQAGELIRRIDKNTKIMR